MHLLTHKPDKIGSAIQEAKEFFVYRVADNTIPDNPKQMAWFHIKLNGWIIICLEKKNSAAFFEFQKKYVSILWLF